jgi:riboflavin-specific deaminase-like protein
VVVDSALRTPLGARLLADGDAPTLVATTARADPARIAILRSRGNDVLLVRADGAGHVDLRELLALLAARGVAAVLIEGGPRLITAALREHLVDRLVVCIAPKILGTGVEAVGDLDASRLDDAIVLGHPVVTRCGEDLIVDGVLERVPLGV